CAHHLGVSTRSHRTDTFGCPSAPSRPYRTRTAVPAGGCRAQGRPHARAEAAKSERSRLGAGEELVSRERNVGRTRRNAHSSPANSGGGPPRGVAQRPAPATPR